MLKYLIILLCVTSFCKPDSNTSISISNDDIETNLIDPIPGAERMKEYMPLLKSKSVAVVVNHTSLVKETHLVDTLLSQGITIKAILAPEHGFKGKADAGEAITDTKYLSNIPVYSLYGAAKKPTVEMLNGIDLIVFDIQDVGARFYTYLSTLHYVLESAAESDIPVVILDRPNPNGHYIDGPVLDMAFKSFVGMHPVPIVYGMTIGEYGKMINGEGWLSNGIHAELTVIPCDNYSHSTDYNLPVAPSPNLPNNRSIQLYPSLCLFEGTTISVGRGTDTQFQVLGHPQWKNTDYQFTPVSSYGSKHPLYENQTCKGISFINTDPLELKNKGQLQLEYLVEAYQNISSQGLEFFNKNNFFEKLAGTDELRKQILSGLTVDDIRSSWQSDLEIFKLIRQKYLIYD